MRGGLCLSPFDGVRQLLKRPACLVSVYSDTGAPGVTTSRHANNAGSTPSRRRPVQAVLRGSNPSEVPQPVILPVPVDVVDVVNARGLEEESRRDKSMHASRLGLTCIAQEHFFIPLGAAGSTQHTARPDAVHVPILADGIQSFESWNRYAGGRSNNARHQRAGAVGIDGGYVLT